MEHAVAEPRVLLRLEGGHRWGLGHVMRGKTLGEALRARGAEVGFCTSAGSQAEAMLTGWGWSVTPVQGGTLLPEPLIADLVVIDMLEQGEPLQRWSRGDTKLLTIDDVGAGLSLADVVINPMVCAWGRYQPSSSSAALYEGPRYAILAPGIAELAAREVSIPPRATRVLLAYGGSDDHAITPRMLDALRLVPGPFTVRVNQPPAGSYSAGTHGGSALKRAMRDHPQRIEQVPQDVSFFDELAAAELVLCAGGSMLLELAALGVPAAAVAGEPHERRNVATFAGLGSCLDLGPHESLQPAAVAASVSALMEDRRRREAMSAAGRAAVDGRGLERVVALIDKLWSS